MRLWLCLLFSGTFGWVDSCELAQDESSGQSPTKLYPFEKINTVNLLEFQEKVNVATSYVASNPVRCARLIATHSQCCKPIGFLYDQAFKVCQPIPWRDGIEIMLQDMGPGNSSLYSFRTNHCKDVKFQTYVEKVGNYSISTCIYTNHVQLHLYPSAYRECQRMGAFLAPAKTQERLALLVRLSQVMYAQHFWIDLDHFGRGLPFRWREDRTDLTQQQTDEMFAPGGTIRKNKFDCVYYKAPGNKIVNGKCDQRLLSFCEMKPGCYEN